MNTKTFFSVAAAAMLAVSAAQAALPDEYALNQNLPAAGVAPQAAAPRSAERVAPVDEYRRNQFPAPAGVAQLQRVQVMAEAREARLLGLIAEGEAGAAPASAAQLEQVRQAGLQAVQQHLAAK